MSVLLVTSLSNRIMYRSLQGGDDNGAMSGEPAINGKSWEDTRVKEKSQFEVQYMAF